MKRRHFLASLLAMGATVCLAEPIAQATRQQIDTAWRHLQDNPFVFAVESDGTIVDPDAINPKTRWDVFHFSESDFRTPDTVIDLAETSPFAHRLAMMAETKCCAAKERLVGSLAPGERRQLQDLVDALTDDPDESWRDWVQWEGSAGLKDLRAAYEVWLSEPFDWKNEFDWLPTEWGQRGAAKRFFEDFDRETLCALGVQIVNGSCPGSSYFAARLIGGLDAANEAARSRRLPFRFQAE